MSFCPETEEAKHQEYPSLLIPALFLHDLYTVQKHHLITFEILKYMYVCVCVCVLSRFSHAWLFATPWTVTRQASLCMEFSRQ